MYYVYILKSREYDEIYTGFTTDLKRRLLEHNSGQSPHTKKFLPWDLVNYIAFNDINTARNFEKYLKTGSGRAFYKKHFL